MGEIKREGESDELERLLGEIPNATSGNSHFEEFGRLKGIQHSNPKNAQVNGLNDQSMATAFGQLNLNNSSAEHVSMNKGFDSSVLGGCQYPKNLMIHNPKMNPRFRTQNSNAFSARNQIAGVPMVNAVQFPPISALEIPAANHQSYFMDPLSLVPSFHSPQMENNQVAWRNLDQENYYRLCQQNLYYQNIASKEVNQNGVPQYYEMPISQGVQQSVQGQTYTSLFPQCFKQSNLGLPSVDRTSQNGVSEKNLSRSNGLRSLRSMKVGAANGQICYNMSNPSIKCFNEDNHNSLGFSQNGTFINSVESGLLPWNCNGVIDANNNTTYLMAKDQHGCRLLQKRISEGDVKEVERVYGEIIDHIVELMTDPFGNYLVQKLLEVCSEDQQTRILQMITRNSGDLIHISCDMHGTRVVQKVIETLRTPEQNFIVINSLKPCIGILMKNTNGNHVAQRCLQHLMPEYSQFIFDAASAYCVELATDRHGCCVLQKCLSYCGGKQRRRLIHEISSNALILSQDQFGNYVVQFLFQLQVPQATLNILNQLEGNFANLSMQKYSSNVVEKCLEHAEERRVHIIQELIDYPRLDQIMQDPYGNYVIQAALTHAKGGIKSKLLEAIEAHTHVLQTSPYGKKVLSCNSLKK